MLPATGDRRRDWTDPQGRIGAGAEVRCEEHAGRGRETVMQRKPLNSYGWGFAWGGVIVFVGVALLLDHLGVVSIGGLWRFWPMILVLAGIVNILDECRRMWGVILLAAGILLQLGEFNLVKVTWALLWPVAVISVGLMLMWDRSRRRKAALGAR